MIAIILAGGKGTRLAPYNTVFPKPLVPLGNRPILDIIIQQLDYYGFNHIVISLGYLGELIEAYYQTSIKGKVKANVEFVRESSPLGTVGALALVEGLDDSFLVINGDTLTTLNYNKVMEFHKEQKGILTVTTHKKQVRLESGVVSLDSEYRVESFVEKPTMSYLVSMGVNIYTPEVLKYLTPGKAVDFPAIVCKMIEDEKKVVSYVSEDYWLDLGTHSDYGKAQEEFDTMKAQLLPHIYT